MNTSIEKVIDGGYCVGCGICASIKDNNAFKVGFNEQGQYEAKIIKNDVSLIQEASKVCPFSQDSINEDEISQLNYGNIPNIKHQDVLGFNLELYAGHVNEGAYREKGSSGGGVSWLICELMKQNLIDGVIHVKECNENPDKIFEYSLSTSFKEIQSGAKSRYYPIELSGVLNKVRDTDLRLAVVGIPCFIKGLRNLTLNDNSINNNIKYFIGIACGHLKSKHFASLFAWQHGVHPEKLKKIDFRHKYESKDAALYKVKINFEDNKGNDQEIISKVASDLYGTDWGLGFFKYKACDYCDDIMAETADILFGDAWVKGFREDWKGDNIVLVRNKQLYDIIENAREQNKLNLKKVDSELILSTQRATIKHRRRGLAYRLKVKKDLNLWAPLKRVHPLEGLEDEKYSKIQNFRMWFLDNVSEIFILALNKNNFQIFKRKLFWPIVRYKFLVFGFRSFFPSNIKAYYRFLKSKVK